jgi:hypothetical protein
MTGEEGGTMHENKGNDCLWSRIRPWAAASLAGIVSMILVCVVEIADPRAILELHQHLLMHIWPAGVPFRAVYVRAGVPFLAFAATCLAMSIKDDVELDSIRDFAAYSVLSKSFGGIFLVPPAILFSAIQAKAGWRAWSNLFGGREFDIPMFVDHMRFIRLFPLQSVAFGLIAFGIKRDRAALLTAGIGGMASLLLYLPAILAGVSGLGLPPFHLDVSVP